ncbi:MAG: UV DNA damage repair endonuclease UvsE [Anaerolineae bacterium]|nr:UV DNA damage repair endonuclease UvsE [Gemmatimonadaceae bacterium]
MPEPVHVPSPSATGRLRWGLCCQFLDAPIRFRTATHRYVATLGPVAGRAYLSAIARDNAQALADAMRQCATLGIGAFRINSQILPLATHPQSGYTLTNLDEDGSITTAFRDAGRLAREAGVRLSFHPDQFVVLNSERPQVVESSLQEMQMQGEIAKLVGADVLTLHAGSAAGGCAEALLRLERGLEQLHHTARQRIALENDDRRFSPELLLPLCERLDIPMVYDVHHHRCNPDTLDVESATRRAAATWRNREPHFHISSPRAAWGNGDPRPHADYVILDDFPDAWREQAITVDVEAKAKERAVLALRDHLLPLINSRRTPTRPQTA